MREECLIVPILIAKCDDIPDYLEPYQHTDFLNLGFEAGVLKLQCTLAGYLLEARYGVRREIKGYLYWLMDDMLYTMQQVFDAGTKETIAREFRQVNRRIKQLRLDNEFSEKWICLKSRVDSSDDSYWTEQVRREFASDIRNLVASLASEAENLQPEFDAGEG